MRRRKPWKSLCESLAEECMFLVEIDVERREERRCRAGVWTKKRADEILLFVRASLECLGSEDARV